MEFHRSRAFAKLFVLLSLFALVFAAISSASQLWFLPPSKVDAAWTPPHLVVYDYIWNVARDLARWGLSQGYFPEEIRQFKSQGVPAFLPWLGLSGLLLTLASVIGLVSLFKPASASYLKYEAEPSLSGIKDTTLKVGDTTDLSSREKAAAPVNFSAAPQSQLSETAKPYIRASQENQLEKLVEESLLYSEAQLSHAQESVERLRRALVNVYLDAGSTATEDMQDLRTSIEELEITLETLKGEQHRVMAALVSQAPSSSHVAATSH